MATAITGAMAHKSARVIARCALGSGCPRTLRHHVVPIRRSALTLLLATTVNADAAHWEIHPNVSMTETYSDNIDLATAGVPARSDYVTVISPGVQMSGSGARM